MDATLLSKKSNKTMVSSAAAYLDNYPLRDVAANASTTAGKPPSTFQQVVSYVRHAVGMDATPSKPKVAAAVDAAVSVSSANTTAKAAPAAAAAVAVASNPSGLKFIAPAARLSSNANNSTSTAAAVQQQVTTSSKQAAGNATAVNASLPRAALAKP
jgi:hypothetical protein